MEACSRASDLKRKQLSSLPSDEAEQERGSDYNAVIGPVIGSHSFSSASPRTFIPFPHQVSRATFGMTSDELPTRKYEINLERKYLYRVANELIPPGIHLPKTQQDEGIFSQKNIKFGYKVDQAVENEFWSAFDVVFHGKYPEDTFDRLEKLMNENYKCRFELLKDPTDTQFRIPKTWAMSTEKRAEWIQLLAGDEHLTSLLRTVPHGLKGSELLEVAFANNICSSRMSWYLKIVILNETIRRKKDICMNEAIRENLSDWTAIIMDALLRIAHDMSNSILEEDMKIQLKKRWIFLLQLFLWQYDEGLLDKSLVWKTLLQMLETGSYEQISSLTAILLSMTKFRSIPSCILLKIYGQYSSKLKELNKLDSKNDLFDLIDENIFIHQEHCMLEAAIKRIEPLMGLNLVLFDHSFRKYQLVDLFQKLSIFDVSCEITDYKSFLMNIVEYYDLEFVITSLLTWAISVELKSPYLPIILVANLLRELTDDSDSGFHEGLLRLIIEKYWDTIDLDLFNSKYTILARLHLELQRTDFLTYGRSLRRLMNSEESEFQRKRLLFILGLRDWKEDFSDNTERQILSYNLDKAFRGREQDQLKIFEKLSELSTNLSNQESRMFLDSFRSLTVFYQWKVIRLIKDQLFKSIPSPSIGFDLNLLIKVFELHEITGEYYLLSEFLVELMKYDRSGDVLSGIHGSISKNMVEFHACNSLHTLVNIFAERFLFFRKTGVLNRNAADFIWNVLRHPCNLLSEIYVRDLNRLFALSPHGFIRERDYGTMNPIACFFDAMRSLQHAQIETYLRRLLVASEQHLLNWESIVARFIHEVEFVGIETRPSYVAIFVRYFRYIMEHKFPMESRLASPGILKTLLELNRTAESKIQSETCACFLIAAISQRWLSLRDVSGFLLNNVVNTNDKKGLTFLEILLDSLKLIPFLLKDSSWNIYEYRCLFYAFLDTETGTDFVLGMVKLFSDPENQNLESELKSSLLYAVETPQFRNSLLLHFRLFISRNHSFLLDSNVLSYCNQMFLFNLFGDLSNTDLNLNCQISRLFSQCFPLDMSNFMLSLGFLNLYIESNTCLSKFHHEMILSLVNILSSGDYDGASELLGLCELILSKRTLDELCLEFFILILDDSFKFQPKLFSKSYRPIISKMFHLFSESELDIRSHLFHLFTTVLKSQACFFLDMKRSGNENILLGTTETIILVIASGGLHCDLDWLESQELHEIIQILLILVSLSNLFEDSRLNCFLVDALVNCLEALRQDRFSTHYLNSIDKILLNPKLPDYTRDRLEDCLFFSSTLLPLEGLRIGANSEGRLSDALGSSGTHSHFSMSPMETTEQDEGIDWFFNQEDSDSKSWSDQSDISRIAFRSFSSAMWIEDYPETSRSSLALSAFEGVGFPRSNEIVYEKQFKIGLQRRNMR